MAEKKEAEKKEEGESKGQGRAIVLSNGERRIDYIRRRYYIDGADRGPIAKEVTEMQDKPCPYQIVFAATKPEEIEIEGKKYTRKKKAEEAKS